MLLAVLPPLGTDDVFALDLQVRTSKRTFDVPLVEVPVDVAEVTAQHLGVAAVEEVGGERRVDEEASFRRHHPDELAHRAVEVVDLLEHVGTRRSRRSCRRRGGRA